MKNTHVNVNKNFLLKIHRCTKAAYLLSNNSDLKKENPHLDSLYKKSEVVKIFARQLFPEGIIIPENKNHDFLSLAHETKFLIESGKRILYQPFFMSENNSAKIDILVIGPQTWKMYEVKMGTSLEDEHVLQASYHAKVLRDIYPDIKLEVYVVYLNKGYKREHEIDIDNLFIIEEITSKTQHAKPLIKRYIKLAEDVLQMKEIPNVDIGIKCNKPYECEFKSFCWSHVPEDSVFDISRMWEINKWKLYQQGIIKLEDVPRTLRLNEKQFMQIDCSVQKRHVINEDAIREYLEDIHYPLYFMDFETIQPPIPPFAGCYPYTQIPFQYSVHYLKSPDSDLIHNEFLIDEVKQQGDPRIHFIKSLTKVLKGTGTIIVYNKSFEESRLREIAKIFPEYEDDIKNILSRIKDLLVPFQERYLYHPKQKGSSSLKAVLPAWVPELSYDSLNIKNGIIASSQFENLSSLSQKERLKVRKDLLKYCELDTYAMVRLLKILENIAQEKYQEIKIAS